MKNYIRIITILLLPFLGGCMEDPDISVVKVKTADEIEYVSGGVVLKGEIETENIRRASIETLGFCYSEEEEPMVSDSTIVLQKPVWGQYSAMLSNLKEETKYYVRAFAQNMYGVVYGEERSFISLTRPKVNTVDVSENNNHELLVSCELLSAGTGEVDLLGVCYSINNSVPTLEKDSVKEVSIIEKGKYELTYPIKSNSKYYVRAVARNIAGIAYGPIKEIVTNIQTYTIILNSNDELLKSISLRANQNEMLQLPANTFVRNGYTFVGWNTEANGSGVRYEDKQNITTDKNVTLYAQWKANTYTLTFKGNGASGSMSSVKVSYNDAYTLQTNTFTRTGYTFIGWNTKADGTGDTYLDKLTITVKGNLTLYAQWEKNTYNITFNSNGGNGSMQNAKVLYNDTYTLPDNTFTRTGYKFISWNTLANGNGTSYSPQQKITVTGDIKLYAIWQSIYTVTFKANGGNGSMAVLSVSSSEKFTLPTNSFTREGYSFVGWNTDADGSGVSYEKGEELMIAGNLTLYAQWEKKSFTIVYNSNGGSGSMQSEQKKYADSYTLKANNYTRTGHTFAGWNTKSDGSGTTYSDKQTISIVGNLTLYAQWEKNTYTITFYSNGGSGSMSNVKVKYLESNKLPANTFTRSGYAFVGWNTDADGSGVSYENGEELMIAGNLTLYAQWKSVPTVTTNSYSDKTDKSAVCSGVVSYNNTISERGICYATNSNPTISSSVVKYSIAGTGSFSCTLSNLNESTTYYYRAYAVYSGGVEYGSVKSFTTYSSPKVTTSSVSNITLTSAYCAGSVSSSYYTITERGVCYSTYSTPTTSSSKVISGSGTGSFTCSLSSLSQGVTYYVRAYAKYSGGVVYGDIKTFRTKTVPQVSELYLLNKSESSIKCEVDVYSPDFSIIERGVCYGKYPNPTIYDNVRNSSASTGKHIYNIDGFSEGITYYLRGYVKYEGGIIYGKELQFTFTTSFKLYFIDSRDWDSVGVIYAYIWNTANDDPNVSNDAGIYKWPGVKANKESITYNGYSIYSFDVSGFNVDYIIFNSYDVSYGNYRYKTKDLKIDLSKPYYYEGSWYGSLSEIP